MTPLDNAMNALMIADAALVALVSTFKTHPAIFMVTPVPSGVVPPYVSVRPPTSQVPNDTKTSQGRAITRDIWCVTTASGSTVTVEAIAERVRELFHRHTLAIAGFHTMIASADGPVVAPTDQTLYGRIVTVTWTVWRV